MNKRIVNWKPVRTSDINGQERLDIHMPTLIAAAYKGELVDRIMAMPRKSPITFAEAVRMASERFLEAVWIKRKIGRRRGEAHWFYEHFLDFISERGFHIELDGEELLSPSHSTN